MNKTLFFYSLNLYSLIVYSAYSTPILLLPSLAAQRSLSSFSVALILMSFPIGAFPASLLIGKLMRFYKKSHLMMLFNTLASVSRFCMGLLYYIDDPTYFMIFAFLSRLLTGISEGMLIPITYSFIPDLYPENSLEKLGILEIWGSVGVVLGAPMATLIYGQLGYVMVFTIMSSINLIVGMFIISCAFDKFPFVSFEKSDKEMLPIKRAIFENKEVLLAFFYVFVFHFPTYMIQTGFQTYMATLTDNLTVSAVVYSLILVGMIFGVVWIKYVHSPKYERITLKISGLLIIFAVWFYGPDPVFGISDDTTQIVFIGVSFLVVGAAVEVIFLIVTKVLRIELLVVFPGENELCADFANGLYLACYTLDELLAPMTGSLLNNYLGYARTGGVYGIMALVYFAVYWSFTRKIADEGYDNMVEEKKIEGTQNDKEET